MSPRPRKALNPKSDDFGVRFGLHFRDLLDKRGLGPSEFLEMLRKAGLDISASTFKSWTTGTHFPRHRDMETIGAVLGLRDYRKLLPRPLD